MSLSTYFHPDDVMLRLAGLITDGLKYHAAAMQFVSADDQIDDLAYDDAIEEAEKAFQCPKLAVAAKFRDNRMDALNVMAVSAQIKPQRQFYQQQLTLNVSYKKMRRRFRKEIARITHVPVLKPSANSNLGEGRKTATGDAPIFQGDHSKPATIGNVASMADWRGILRKSA